MKIVLRGQRLEMIPETAIDDMAIGLVLKKSTTFIDFNYRGKLITKVDKTLYIQDGDRSILSRNQLEGILFTLEDVGVKNTIVEEEEVDYKFKDIEVKLNDGFDFRDEIQRDYNTFLLEDRKSYLCTLQTGKGKTGATIISLVKRGNTKRFCLLIPPRFHDIWLTAFELFTDIKKSEILVISGRKALYDIPNISDDIKAVIISPPTIREFMKSYIDGEELPIQPEEILNYIGCDHLIIDEAHEDFVGNYLNVLALNPNKYIALTASFSSSQDARKIKSHKEYFIPTENRLPQPAFDKYVNVVFCQFKFQLDKDLKFINPSKGWYNHNLLEESILKLSRRWNNYFNMLIHFMDIYYDNKHRCLILMARVDMCKAFKVFLSRHSKYSKKTIATYTQGDSKDNLTADIIVSTGKSGGTGIDIQNVQTTVNTISTKSEYAGTQFSGRTRKMEGVDQYYLSLWATNIPAQGNYKRQNNTLFMEIGKTISNNYYHEVTI